jgi:pyrimidine deaminase RibD-like protein
MRASDFEISNYSKLDKILSKLCEMVVKGQQSEKDYGMVAAAVVDPDNQIVARLNRPGKDGKRIHAEHAAMLDYISKYGDIPKGSIIITTLSPCNEHMDERDGPSCTELINNSTVKKVYCGYMDPTQDDDTRQFNLMETADRSLRNKCKQFADTFLDNVHETHNLQERRKKTKVRQAGYGPGLFGGYGYYSNYSGDSGGDGGGGESISEFAVGGGDDEDGDDPYKYPKPERYRRSIDFFGQFEADHFDREDFNDATGVFKGYWDSKQIAYFKFDHPEKTDGDDSGMGWYYEPQSDRSDDKTSNDSTSDNSDKRKQQELSMINAFLKSGQTPKPGSQIYSLMKKHGVVENFADGKNPQDKGDSKRHGVPTKASVSTLRKVAKQGGRKGQLAHWMANMKTGKKK